MSASNRSSGGRWIWGIVVLGGLTVTAGLEWQRGWVDLTALLPGPADKSRSDAQKPSVAAPKKEWSLPPELLEAQSEPELDEADIDDMEADLSLETGRGAIPAESLFDEFEDEVVDGVVSANFEELDDEAPAREKPAGPKRAEPPISNEQPTSRAAPLMELKQIAALESAGDYVAAQKELSRWYLQSPDERESLIPRLERMAKALYFDKQPLYYEPYVVQPGDQLRLIAKKHKLSWEYLSVLNRVEPQKIRAGQKLKVVPGPFGARINLSRHELVVLLDGSYVKRYQVGVGMDGLTPIGTFKVLDKTPDPTFYGPDGVIAHDDPQNPLGERWIDLGDHYGIHGTIGNQGIGKNESQGCIRMRNPDVEEVYDFLAIGSKVTIEH
ncbi:MAG: LysM peptidoglycan-binding domain-containing protein [Planctomycetaceae bacterium]|nr:LysM peptidoglycan-binding domain-containing protein [Planctomycetaceae bacterium]